MMLTTFWEEMRDEYCDWIGVGGGEFVDGKEVVAKWQVVDMDNDGVFYTDSNGLEM